jgi:mgtE-like transporter
MSDEVLPRLSARAVAALASATRRLLAHLRGTARLPLLREVLAHWLREGRTIRQGFVALGLCLGVSTLAGVFLGSIEGLLERLPGLLILVPAVIGIRGSIFGALGARLGTGMLTGQFGLAWERRSFAGQNVEAAALLSVSTAGLIAVLGWGLARLVGEEVISVFELLVIAMTGAVLSSAVVLVMVLALARTAERRSWDMDAIGTPIISATADLLTLPSLVAGTLLVGNPVVDALAGGLCLAAAVAAAVGGVRNAGPLVRRVARESLPIISYTAVVGVLAGTVLQARQEALSQALLAAVPPFNASCGAIGGVLSARLSSSLHLGLIRPRSRPERAAGLEGSLALLFGLVAFAAVGLLTQVVTSLTGFDSPGPLSLAGTTLTGGLLAIGVIFVVGYYTATASYRFGLDPDNVSIPVVTSTMDLMGTLCLVAGVALFGRL